MKFGIPREDLSATVRETAHKLRRPAKYLAAGLLAFVISADSMVDLFGDLPGPSRTDAEIAQVGLDRWGVAYSQTSKANRYAMQFLGNTDVDVYDHEDIGSGMLGKPSTSRVQIGNPCLDNTAYDTNGGDFNISVGSLFTHSEASASTPTALAAVSEVEGKLVVGSDSNQRLTFIDKDNRLQPADETTRGILRTYGCSQSIADTVSIHDY